VSDRICGDRLLVDQLRSEAQARNARHLMGRVARCWDLFGLPDGSRNPGRRRTDGQSFCLQPTEDMIHDSMNTLLGAVLPKRDVWLLDIPRVLLPDRSGAEVLISRRGAAMGLPWSAFGGLFFANYLYLCLLEDPVDDASSYRAIKTWRARKIKWRLRRRIPPGLCRHALTHWMTGCAVAPKAKPAAEKLEAALTLLMMIMIKQVYPQEDQSIWAMTTFQQAIMVIHEFGHVVALRDAHVQDVVHQHSVAEELQADRWGLESNKRLVRRLFGTSEAGSVLAARSLLFLYSVLEFIEYPERADPRREDMAIRCAAYIRELVTDSPFARIDESAVFDFFETMRESFAERLPAMYLFILLEAFLQDMHNTVEVSYEDDHLRKMVGPVIQPWDLL
jgi:hypothetical protein